MIPSGCLSLILFVVLLFVAVFSMMKKSDVYQHSMEVAQKNEQVIEKIGNQIESDGMISGNISTTNYSGNAQLDIPIKGTKGTGLLHVIAVKQNNIWTYHTLEFYKKDSDAPINLLDRESKE
jgi:hypothetical protein